MSSNLLRETGLICGMQSRTAAGDAPKQNTPVVSTGANDPQLGARRAEEGRWKSFPASGKHEHAPRLGLDVLRVGEVPRPANAVQREEDLGSKGEMKRIAVRRADTVSGLTLNEQCNPIG